MNPVYDIVLLPPQSVDKNSIMVSRQLSQFGTEFILQKNILYPHLSLYMVNLTPENVDKTTRLLADIAAKMPPLQLEAMRYAHDFTQGMFEITYKENKALDQLQQKLIAVINPLREGLRIKDPVGHILAKWLPKQTGELRNNLERYGYDEVGNFFRPHITFTRFIKRDTSVILSQLPPVEEFNGVFTQLGLFEMGEHGTCIREIATFHSHTK
ncbi:MAG: DUF1045 domain-containing protein [Candidatus Levyibacteriota bacterium]